MMFVTLVMLVIFGDFGDGGDGDMAAMIHSSMKEGDVMLVMIMMALDSVKRW